MNKELFELHTEIKSFIKDKSSSFKLDLPTTLFKRELKAVYRKLVLIRVAELLSGINLLAKENNGIGCIILSRSLFELYMQIAFIFKVDNLHAFRSYFYYADYQSLLKLTKVEQKHLSNEENYNELQSRINNISNEVQYFDYRKETRLFKAYFSKAFADVDVNISENGENYWASLNFEKLSDFLGSDTSKLYKLYYWQFSNLVHSTPRGIIEGYQDVNDNNRKWVETALVFSSDLSSRLINILFKGQPEIELYASICGIQGRLNDICGKLESSLPSKC